MNNQKINKMQLPDVLVNKLVRFGFLSRDEHSLYPEELVFLSGLGIVNKKDASELLGDIKLNDIAIAKVNVMKALIKRGYVVRSMDDDYVKIYKKGVRAGMDRTRWIGKVVLGYDKITGDTVKEVIMAAKDMRKSPLIVISDVVNDKITFLSISIKPFE